MAPNSVGTPDGSNCARNNAQRSASSSSPISAAARCNANRHRKNPWFDGAIQRTYPEPRQPFARNASRPR